MSVHTPVYTGTHWDHVLAVTCDLHLQLPLSPCGLEGIHAEEESGEQLISSKLQLHSGADLGWGISVCICMAPGAGTMFASY